VNAQIVSDGHTVGAMEDVADPDEGSIVPLTQVDTDMRTGMRHQADAVQGVTQDEEDGAVGNYKPGTSPPTIETSSPEPPNSPAYRLIGTPDCPPNERHNTRPSAIQQEMASSPPIIFPYYTQRYGIPSATSNPDDYTDISQSPIQPVTGPPGGVGLEGPEVDVDATEHSDADTDVELEMEMVEGLCG
jgi:hypothetical protein